MLSIPVRTIEPVIWNMPSAEDTQQTPPNPEPAAAPTSGHPGPIHNHPTTIWGQRLGALRFAYYILFDLLYIDIIN